MPVPVSTVLAYVTRRAHERMLQAVDSLDEAAFTRSGGTTAPSIAFHVWHTARWADRLQAHLAGMTDEMRRRLGQRHQLWTRDGLAAAWGLPAGKLGEDDSGMGMDEGVSVTMPLPAKETLLEYARDAFAAANEAVAAADDEQLTTSGIDLYGRETSVAAAVGAHIAHASRHLGMIEALKGVAGARGTASV